MLEDVRKSYEVNADSIIPNWKDMDKNDLARLYVQNEEDEYLRDAYFAALVCRYWYNIGKYYNQSKNSVNIEECYDWLIHALLYALKNRKWLDPKSTMYNDPSGPDKIINRCIASTRQIFYQASNTAKRKANYHASSVEKSKELFGNNYTDSCLTEPVLRSEDDVINDIACCELIQHYANNDKIVEAVIIDGICYQDTFKEVKIDNLNSKYEFSLKKLIKHLCEIDETFVHYFSTKYNINYNDVQHGLINLPSNNNQKLYKIIDKAIYDIKNSLFVRSTLCS